jgi:hypothetical protein
MPEYDSSGKGVIFKNDKKGNDKAPDYKGKGNFNGQDFEMALYVQTSKKDGSKFFSVRFQKPYKKPETPVQQYETPIVESEGGEFPF